MSMNQLYKLTELCLNLYYLFSFLRPSVRLSVRDAIFLEGGGEECDTSLERYCSGGYEK